MICITDYTIHTVESQEKAPHLLQSFAYFLLLSGFAMGVSWLFLFEAYRQVGVSVASLGYYCGPIIVMALSPILFNEKLTKRLLLCFFAVIVGIVLVDGNAFYELRNFIGIAFALMSAVMCAVPSYSQRGL